MNKIKIGFDISQLAHPGGVATYTSNLAQKLALQPKLQMSYLYSSLRVPYTGPLPHVKSYQFPPTVFEKLFNHLRVIPVEKFIGNVDIFHSSDWTQPKTKAKKITTYHDVIPLKYPQWSDPRIVRVHQRRLKLVEREIDKVICVSEATKRDLLSISSLPEEKLMVIYEGVGAEFKPQEEKSVSEFRAKLKLPKKFILAIGGVGTRRNLERVKQACLGYDLVISGQTIKRVSVSEMPLLYAAATILVYPSLYEGFGLPILEAMAVGTPVITSNVSSMPEVGGEAALYVDPNDVADITGKVRSLMEDEAERARLRKLGFNQSEKFSWERCVGETVKVYKGLSQ